VREPGRAVQTQRLGQRATARCPRGAERRAVGRDGRWHVRQRSRHPDPHRRCAGALRGGAGRGGAGRCEPRAVPIPWPRRAARRRAGERRGAGRAGRPGSIRGDRDGRAARPGIHAAGPAAPRPGHQPRHGAPRAGRRDPHPAGHRSARHGRLDVPRRSLRGGLEPVVVLV
ncbi:MAG: hypothetical protein AVDCRST_MAG49-2835, partial [uncultured Thermomicrobiales bacterium]